MIELADLQLSYRTSYEPTKSITCSISALKLGVWQLMTLIKDQFSS